MKFGTVGGLRGSSGSNFIKIG